MAEDQIYVWRVIPGDDESRTFTYEDGEGNPVDLTGYTATITTDVGGHFEINGDLDSIISATIDGDPETGRVEVVLSAEATALWKVEGHFHLTLTSPAGMDRTIVHGPIKVVR